MPINIHIEPHGCLWELHGIATAEEVDKANQASYEAIEKFNHWYIILDMLKLDKLDLDEMELVDVSVDDASFSRKYPNIKLAAIIKDPELKKIIIKYFTVSWALNNGWEFRIYDTIEAARDWFNVPDPED
jgi:hypothetical protein